jgi:hypothetical protein
LAESSCPTTADLCCSIAVAFRQRVRAQNSFPALAEHDLGLKPDDWSVLLYPLTKANGNEKDSFEFKLQLASYSEKQAKA